MITILIQSGLDSLGGIAQAAVTMLPPSPFQTINNLSVGNQVLKAIAWFVPIPQIIAVLEAWGVAIGVYYLAATVLKWAKVIGS